MIPTLRFQKSCLAAALMAATLPLGAHEAGGYRQLDAHVHGEARLDLVAEGTEVQIALTSPAANLVGFEHAPANAAERERLSEALATLKQGERLFRLTPAAECRLEEAVVDTPLAGGKVHDHEKDHEHDHDHEDDHDNEHEHGHAEAHADVDATYRFTCARPDRVEGVEVMLFDAFPGTARLRVQYVTEQGQGGADLTPSNPSLRF
jgi:hypothetical protein